MKKYFVCEQCNANYENEAEAIACEEKHLIQKQKREKMLKEQEVRKKEVIEARKTYIELLYAYRKDYETHYRWSF